MKKYQSIQLFSGGGARFAYYLGSYAALVAANSAPNALLGSCGGSIAAWLVAQTPEPQRLYQLATSAALYRALANLWVCHALPHRLATVFQAALRYWQTRSVSRLQRIHLTDKYDDFLQYLSDYALFEQPENPQTWLQTVADFAAQLPNPQPQIAPDIWLNASRILPQSPVLFQQILFTNQNHLSFRLPDNPNFVYAPHRQMRSVACVSCTNFQAAVLASIADMFYLKPIDIQSVGYCMGGVMDLVPIELAYSLAETVFAEEKPRYDNYLAAPAIARVFGTPAHLRWQQVADFMAKHRDIHALPLADNRTALAGRYVAKRYDWFSGCLKIQQIDADLFAEYVDAQWQYGYDKTMIYLEENIK